MNQVDVNMARNSWSDAYECLQRAGQNDLSSNYSMHEILASEECNYFDPDTISPLEKLFMWNELVWEFVLDPAEASAKGNLPLNTYDLLQDKDWFVTSEQIIEGGKITVPGNLATVADKAVKTYIPDYETTALLDFKATNIEWVEWDPTDSDTGVTVTTQTQTLKANKVRINLESNVVCKPQSLIFGVIFFRH